MALLEVGGSLEGLRSWVKKEVHFPGVIKIGARGKPTKRVQEWLKYHDHAIDIDGDFGNITRRAVPGISEAAAATADWSR